MMLPYRSTLSGQWRRFLGVLILALTLTLTDCGGGGSPPPPAPGNPVPTLAWMSPSSATAGGPEFTLTVNGSNFIPSSVVRWIGSNRPTIFLSSTQLTAAISANDITSAGARAVNVFNPGPGGGFSSFRYFTIDNPVPTLTSVSPAAAAASSWNLALTLTGSNFNPQTIVMFGGANISVDSSTTTSTQISASVYYVPSSSGPIPVVAINPPPGGGTSNALTVDLFNPVPRVFHVAPWSAVAGAAGFTLKINGDMFVTNSVVRWNGADRPTTFQDRWNLQIPVSTADLATAGNIQVTVFNPPPQGGLSNSVTFPITLPPPLVITTTRLPASAGGKSYYFISTATGGIPTYSWTLASGSSPLPSGLTLDPTTGLISGTLSNVGADTTFDFTLALADSASTPNTTTQNLSVTVHAGPLGRNDACSAGTIAGTTLISNGRLRASISPYGDIDVYSFYGTSGHQVTIETFAQRLNLYNDNARDSQLDSVLELLDSNCNQLAINDDINPGIIQDSLIPGFSLPTTGIYFIRVRDFRGDGRPDLIYDLSLSGAD